MSEKLENVVITEENSKNDNPNAKNEEENSLNYDYTKSKKELELKHIELNLYQRKWIVYFILGYVALVFVFTVILIMYLKNCHVKLHDIFIFLENCPYFLVFIIALLLVPVWCLTSIAKVVFKVKQNVSENENENKRIKANEDNVMEDKVLIEKFIDFLSNVPKMHG